MVRAASRRRSTTSASTRGRCRIRCRSGSRSAARRESAVRAGHARPADGARDHRRPAGALRAVRRAAPRAPRPGRARPRACRSASTRTATSPTRRSRRPTSRSRALRRDDERDRPRARLAADDPRRSSTPRATLRGALFVGSPQEVVEKILFQHEIFGHQRFLLQMSVGTMPHDAGACASIELLGTEVAPAVRAEIARRDARAAPQVELAAAGFRRPPAAGEPAARASPTLRSTSTSPNSNVS